MKNLLLSTFIFLGLFCTSINSVNAEALTDAERLQMLQKHAGDIAFVDDTTLADVAWLTIGLDEEGLKWLTEYLKKQSNLSHTDLLEAIVSTQNPDRDAQFYMIPFRRIKAAWPQSTRDLAEKYAQAVESRCEAEYRKTTRPRKFILKDLLKDTLIVTILVPATVLALAGLYYTNSNQLRPRVREDLNDLHRCLGIAAKKCTQVTTVGTALVLTGIVAKNVLGKS